MTISGTKRFGLVIVIATSLPSIRCIFDRCITKRLTFLEAEIRAVQSDISHHALIVLAERMLSSKKRKKLLRWLSTVESAFFKEAEEAFGAVVCGRLHKKVLQCVALVIWRRKWKKKTNVFDVKRAFDVNRTKIYTWRSFSDFLSRNRPNSLNSELSKTEIKLIR